VRIKISTPYRENSIVNIASGAAIKGWLANFYTTLYLAQWVTAAQRLPLIGNRLAQELGRRAFPDIPTNIVSNVGMVPELLHVGACRILSKHWPRISSELMYRVKAQFDIGVARRLSIETSDVFVGMYGASVRSFETIRKTGGLAVLNFVNSHPDEHNRYLIELAGLKAPHHELIPQWVAKRVEEELALAHLVLVPSHFVARQLSARGVPEDKIAMIPYGVNLEAFQPVSGLKKRTMLECLYVGQISYRKGIQILLDAAKQCQDLPIRFRLVGPIVSRELLAQLPENVRYEGPTLPGGVANAMRTADMFVLPTLEDSYALVVLEAMATGLPIITTDHAGSAEVLTDGVNGLVTSAGSSEVFANAIRRLVDDEALREKLGVAGRELVVSGAYSWNTYGDKVLQEIAAKREALA